MADEELNQVYFELIPWSKFNLFTQDKLNELLSLLKKENIAHTNKKLYRGSNGNFCYKFHIQDRQKFLLFRIKYGF
jgi:hypothetical protein